MQPQQRYIAHFDLDSFFVSVEVLNNPALKGLPVLVGGSRERGVVAACSYEARKFGVHSAMPMKKALQLCPQAVLVRGTRGEYSRYSRMVTEIIAAKAPLFEKASIDEFYLDLTGMDKFFNPYQWTIELRQSIIERTKLPISFALASNKMIAKIATDEAKPNGYIFVQPGMEKDFLGPLKVGKIPGVGKHTEETLKNAGIFYIRDIAQRTVEQMEAVLGNYGAELWHKAHGKHEGIVQPYHEAKSISTENTFHENTDDEAFLLSELVRMTEKVAYELRQDEKLAGCITVKLRYPNFETTSRQVSIDYTFRDDELIPVAKDLYHKLYRKGNKIRLMGVRLSDLTNHAMQGSLFDDAEKKNNLYKAIDAVKNKYGNYALNKARTIRGSDKEDKEEKEP
ncbi:DNA polymerase IV [Deminuibacter soli]|uniref:DNA polymerase IV n=1 Tax=Deminuibacter soli TaxID=2291815 RepID=A0A3E1NNY6_9BACT|nr:DNA polymerase IV [Deminuibacter soli]RFM29633.1 DNA polymerase IV [Deminuibacter soli]